MDPEYTDRLRSIPGGQAFAGGYTLDDLEDMLGYIAAEANHCDDRALQKELDAFYHRLYELQRSYDDGDWNDSD